MAGVAPLVVILGETASGKTALGIELAKQLDGEIICADSWTVYKGFDIGTAKPTLEERQGIPHHLLDVADPDKGFSAAVFQRLAKQAIVDISNRGKLPIMVGGTGLYIDSVLYDFSFLPPSDPALRDELNSLSLEQLHERAKKMGLDVSKIDAQNKRRVIRLIENNGTLPTKKPLRPNTIVLGISRPLDELKDRINTRTRAMVQAGLADEVRQLGECYGWDCEPMKAPGYRAFSDYVRGTISLDEAIERTITNDLQLAKKQRTYFRRNNSIHWLDDRSNLTDIVDFVTTGLNN